MPVNGFSLEAAKRAAYDLMGSLDVSFTLNDQTLCGELRPTGPDVDAAAAEREFRRSLLDHELRLSTEQRTEPMRSAILGLAFSKTGLQRE